MKCRFLIVLLLVAINSISFTTKLQAQIKNDPFEVLKKVEEVLKWSKTAFVLLSSDDDLEEFLHNEVANQINQEYTVYTSEWLTGIGETLVSQCERPILPNGLSYTFRIIDSEDFNAFAAPGGAVYVTRPLYDALNRDELAFVLGHEIGHICRKHSISKIKSDHTFLTLKELARYEIKKDQETEELLDALVTATFLAIQAGYSRDWERDVDKYGVHLAYLAGYKPEGALSALQKLGDATDSWGASCFLWCTHPKIEERIQYIREEIPYSNSTNEKVMSTETPTIQEIFELQLKIGCVDVVRLKKEYKEYVAAEARFEKMMAVWQGKADSMQSDMKDIADKLEKPSPLLTDQGKNELREKLLVKQNEYQLYVNQVMGQDGEAAQKEAELSKPLIDKINTVIKLIALKGSYSFVLDSTAGSVLYASENYDLTDQVLAELNK